MATDALAVVGQRIWSDGERTWICAASTTGPDIRLPGRKSLRREPGPHVLRLRHRQAHPPPLPRGPLVPGPRAGRPAVDDPRPAPGRRPDRGHRTRRLRVDAPAARQRVPDHHGGQARVRPARRRGGPGGGRAPTPRSPRRRSASSPDRGRTRVIAAGYFDRLVRADFAGSVRQRGGERRRGRRSSCTRPSTRSCAWPRRAIVRGRGWSCAALVLPPLLALADAWTGRPAPPPGRCSTRSPRPAAWRAACPRPARGLAACWRAVRGLAESRRDRSWTRPWGSCRWPPARAPRRSGRGVTPRPDARREAGRAIGPRTRPATLPPRDHPPVPPAQLLDHRAHRSRQVHARGPPARADPHDRGRGR